jgi:hypothetical protein
MGEGGPSGEGVWSPGEASTSDRPCGSDYVSERRDRASPTRTAGALVGAEAAEAGEDGEVVAGKDCPGDESPNVGGGGGGGDDGPADPWRRGARRRREGGGGDDDEGSTKRSGSSRSGPHARGGLAGLLKTATLAVCFLACLLPTALGSLYAPGTIYSDGGDGTPVTVPTAVTSVLPETTGSSADAKLTYAAYYAIKEPYWGVATGGTVVRTHSTHATAAPIISFWLFRLVLLFLLLNGHVDGTRCDVCRS